MNTKSWIQRFQRNHANRPEPDWNAPVNLPLTALKRVLSSLEQFELGDGGGPASLIAFNAPTFSKSSDDIGQIVDLWFAEEREHSRLLGRAVKRFGGRKLSGHWSFSAFCGIRRILGVRFELEVLLLTEIVSTAYYRVLRRHIDDTPLEQMCDLILRDESGHVAFHRDRLASAMKHSPGILWQAQFWGCGFGAATMLWVNHAPCLKAIGGSRAEYFQEVRFEISRFIRRLGNATLRNRVVSSKLHEKLRTALA